MLYALEAGEQDVERTLQTYWRETPGDAEGRPYADDVVRGVADHRAVIDERIRSASEHWRLERMARVDRNVLRIGVFELLERPEVPRAVIIDEAVELAKRYGTEDSGKFVNGVLDRIAEDVGRRDEDDGARV